MRSSNSVSYKYLLLNDLAEEKKVYPIMGDFKQILENSRILPESQTELQGFCFGFAVQEKNQVP